MSIKRNETTESFDSRIVSANKVGERAENLKRGLTRFAVANLAPVDGYDGNQFGGASSKETLVGGIDVVPRKRRLGALQSKFLTNLNDDVTRHALKNAGVDRRRYHFAILDDEDIVAGALADVALMIEHQRLFATRDMRFNFMGQICLQNSLFYSIAATWGVWQLLPSLEKLMTKAGDTILDGALVGMGSFFIFLELLYHAVPPKELPSTEK